MSAHLSGACIQGCFFAWVWEEAEPVYLSYWESFMMAGCVWPPVITVLCGFSHT